MNTWNRLLITVLCDYCICTCIDDAVPSPSRYALSFNAALSHYDKNEVVTGIKFIMKDNVVYPQIQTGKILAQGYIQPDTVKWESIKISKTTQSKYYGFTNNSNVYFGTGWNEVRRIGLNDVYVDDGFVVTGKYIK